MNVEQFKDPYIDGNTEGRFYIIDLIILIKIEAE